MNTFLTWASIVGLSATPNLILGPSVAVGVGIAAHYSPWILLPVVAVSGYVEGLIVAWLADETLKIGVINRWIARMRTPRAVAFANRWGIWGGLTAGCAVLGQEPILVALRWLGVGMGRLWVPLAVSNAVFALIYYAVVQFGLDQMAGF
ncbi:MAG: hypothetical protein EKK46_15615 [Rhodocyclaceae bacterium]|nr:MAG: hypothetical protein EKK46_15615 [Rhodocyclaceae bacterium]